MSLSTRSAAERLGWWKGVAVGAVLVGAVLRLYQLGEDSLWVDEGHTLMDATLRPLTEVLFIPSIKLHMPLYYLIIRFWTAVFGVSETSLRFPSLLFGVGSIVALAYLGTRLYDVRVGALSASFLAVSSFHIYHSQEARMYTLTMLLTLVSFALLLRAAESGTRRDWAGYVVCSVLLVLSNATGGLILLAQNAYVFGAPLLGRDHRFVVPWRRWVGVQSVVGLVLSPWLVLFVLTLTQRDGSGTLPGRGAATVVDIAVIPVQFLTGGINGVATVPVAVVLIAVVAGFGALGLSAFVVTGSERGWRPRLDRESRDLHLAALVATWAGIPIVLPSVLIQFDIGLFGYRYMLPAFPAVLLLLSNGLLKLDYARVGTVVAVLVLVVQAGSIPGYYAAEKQQFDDIAAYVEANADEGDLVVVGEGGSTFGGSSTAFGHYYDRETTEVRAVRLPLEDDDLSRFGVTPDRTVWVVQTVTPTQQYPYQTLFDPLSCSHERVRSERFPSDNSWHHTVHEYEPRPEDERGACPGST
jgi:uncharacterized membrane protein